MRSTKIEFEGSLGELLSARLDEPNTESRACMIFAHCFTCSKNLKVVGNITKTLAARGIATLRFDFTGLGESEGDFANTNFSSNVEDLIAAYNYMKEHHTPPAILTGHSLGGAAVLQAAHRMDSVKAVATIGAPSDPEHVKQNFALSIDQIESEGEAEVTLAGRSFKIKKQFLDDLEGTSMENYIHSLKRSLIIFHSPIDNTVGIDNAGEIFKSARHPKSFISLDQADHLLTNDKDSIYVGEVLASWAAKYI
ncbi:alpha/beta hydrolase family protein [Balneola sp. MJW-20]|uniref:alpha/beta hydrolase family protein n=1 Tax=Gracilimonas aurantiaca TaxID=3234185 RepID=UPI0034677180